MKLTIRWDASNIVRPKADHEVSRFLDELVASFRFHAERGDEEYTVMISQEILFAAIRVAIFKEMIKPTTTHLIVPIIPWSPGFAKFKVFTIDDNADVHPHWPSDELGFNTYENLLRALCERVA